MVKTKALAQSFCYWKGLDKDIEDNISKCRQCREKQNLPKKEINHPWEPASEPWERVHIDFAGPTNGNYFLLVVDAFRKWVEVIPMKSITSSWTIRELRKIFTTFGLPSVIVSDNGHQFTSPEFSNFLKKCGTLHKMTAPYHPSSNGQVERFVQTIKKLINCMSDEPGTLEEKLHQLLMKMKGAVLLLALAVVMAAVSLEETTPVAPKKHYCGRGLTTSLQLLCNVTTSTTTELLEEVRLRSRRRAHTMLGLFRRRRRGVYDECCRKSCTVTELSSYCGLP
ncbi:uncharacterized protein K02A2.6-like [Macrosteles quadrilineatus]|uniref:uncharacterized protein K02A2.6-like n=1 Tax=Macrosteles quadrilineatus TaxID=74068 RepID=UPI0023E18139|nr:uncharacterized protein K02A2.6-like [Macrosteles quadrilineatus]